MKSYILGSIALACISSQLCAQGYNYQNGAPRYAGSQSEAPLFQPQPTQAPQFQQPQNQPVPNYYNSQQTTDQLWQSDRYPVNQPVQQAPVNQNQQPVAAPIQQPVLHSFQQPVAVQNQQPVASNFSQPDVAPYSQPNLRPHQFPVSYRNQQPVANQYRQPVQGNLQQANTRPQQFPVSHRSQQPILPPQLDSVPQQSLEPLPRNNPAPGYSNNNNYSNEIGSLNSYDNNAYNSGSCSDCGDFDCSCNCYCPTWFGYAGVLTMDRNPGSEVWLSNDAGDLGAQIIGTHDAGLDWSSGYEIRLGRHFGCNNWAWELVYWGVQKDSEFSVIDDALTGSLDTPLDANFQGLSYNDGGGVQNLTAYFNDAEIHRLRRSYEFYNAELNFFQDPNFYNSYGSGCNFRLGMVAGLRHIKFKDGMIFSTDITDQVFDGDPTELHYDVDAENNLYGAQLGFIGQVDHRRIGFYGGTKFGLYGNNINHRSRIFGTQGNAFINNGSSPNNGEDFNISSSKTDISFVGELDFGARVRVSRCFSFKGGYRAVAITGVALSTDQVPQNFEDLQLVSSIQSSGQVVLHGAYFGGEFIW